MKSSDWAIVFATLLGPILAVQAQKYLERIRESKRGKIWVFKSLMTTRATRVSPRHIEALNAIDLEFYSSNRYKRVVETWHIYLDHLTNTPNDEDVRTWTIKGDDLFTDLLYEMGHSLGYKFDKVYIKRHTYYPQALSDWSSQQVELVKNMSEAMKKIQ